MGTHTKSGKGSTTWKPAWNMGKTIIFGRDWMSRSKENPINLCDECEDCEERYKTVHNCMNVCGYPLDILLAHEHGRNAMENDEK